MWRFNLTNNQWTWVAGSSSANTVTNYVSLGTESTGAPGARAGCGMVIDANGFIYLYGGTGFGSSTNGNGISNRISLTRF